MSSDKASSGALSLEARMGAWVESRIGKDHLQTRERAMRLLEEAIELAQAEGITIDQVSRQAEHVFARPAGSAFDEAAGVTVCLLAYCYSRNVALEDLARIELARIERKPLDQIRGSLARKADADLVTTLEHPTNHPDTPPTLTESSQLKPPTV